MLTTNHTSAVAESGPVGASARGGSGRRHGRSAVVVAMLLALCTMFLPASSAAAATPYYHKFAVSAQCPASLTTVDMAAISRWTTAPKNGYMQLVRQRQAIADDGRPAVTATKMTQTKNTTFEGNRKLFTWNKFAPTAQANQWNNYTRSVFQLKYMKDDKFSDTVVKTSYYATQWCMQPT